MNWNHRLEWVIPMLIKCTNRDWPGDLHWRQAQCAQEAGGVRPGAVRPVLGAVETSSGDENDKCKNICKRQDQISHKNGAIRLLTELCSSYRLLNVPAAATITGRNLGRAALRSEPALFLKAPLNEGQRDK
ncbi:hypothetical protein L2E82_22270 [Cichorium intybus]|uniref:Uncharacterized protein n=1 Tax=Cichorium intybus TaxID=13427 RepID=A0ACB9DXC7_CICIN|nr:hypothetical protein L2E82_22270 [Cichorium intybus]